LPAFREGALPQKVLKENANGVTRGSIKRLARRGGIKRISGLLYDEVRTVLNAFVDDVVLGATASAEHAHRKTVSVFGRHAIATHKRRFVRKTPNYSAWSCSRGGSSVVKAPPQRGVAPLRFAGFAGPGAHHADGARIRWFSVLHGAGAVSRC
jgi:histone H3/H4